MELYDIVIIGAGPSGLFAAVELERKLGNCKILLLDKGDSLDERIRKNLKNSVVPEGFGGAGGFSDGKLIFSTEVGGNLSSIIPQEELDNLMQENYKLWNEFIDDLTVEKFLSPEANDLVVDAKNHNIDLIISDIIHVGSDVLPFLLKNIEKELYENIDILTNSEVFNISKTNNSFLIETSDKKYSSNFLIVAPGRGGSKWLNDQLSNFETKKVNNPVDIGVRVEIPYSITKNLTDRLYEFKMRYITPSYSDLVRTFCVCPKGQVVIEKNKDILLANGYSNIAHESQNTNFALLVSIKLGPPVNLPLIYSNNVAKIVNNISGGILVQRLGDLLSCKRSSVLSQNSLVATLKEALPGDLGLAYPYRVITDIIEGLQGIDKWLPGVSHNDTLLYAPEIKMYSSMIAVDAFMQATDGFYVCGDGAGITRGIVQASISGMSAAKHIVQNF